MTDQKTKIIIKNNGPVRIEGTNFEVCDASGKVFDLGGRSAISICRCGQTKKQPFCDGTHSSCSFTSEVIAFDLPPK